MTELPAELPDVRLDATTCRVLAALGGAAGRKLSAGDLARTLHLSTSTVGKRLKALHAARLVQCVDQRQQTDRPPHRVWWPTPAGTQVAQALAQPTDPAAGSTAAGSAG